MFAIQKCVDVMPLTDYGISVTIYDPLASPSGQKEYKLVTSNTVPNQKFDAVVLAVAHAEFFRHGFIEYKIK
jgi:UDP-N-acetyl-D-galactosamine dehydrogenase